MNDRVIEIKIDDSQIDELVEKLKIANKEAKKLNKQLQEIRDKNQDLDG